MSGGRVELGLGAGWFEAEHTAYGIPFPDTGERFDRFEEQLADHHRAVGDAGGRAVLRSTGEHYTLADSPALPKPVQSPRPPVIIGGGGQARTPALAARYADEFNIPFRSPRTPRRCSPGPRGLRGRPGPASWPTRTRLCGAWAATTPSSPAGRRDRPDVDELRRTAWPARRRRWSTGSAYADAGAQRLYLQCSTWPTSTTST